MNHLKGESLNASIDRGINLEFHEAKVTSDGSLLAHRDLDDALGLFDSVSANFHDNRTGRNIQHDMLDCYHNSKRSILIFFRRLIWEYQI